MSEEIERTMKREEKKRENERHRGEEKLVTGNATQPSVTGGNEGRWGRNMPLGQERRSGQKNGFMFSVLQPESINLKCGATWKSLV